MEDHIRFIREEMTLDLLDQRLLPLQEERFLCRSLEDVIYALQTMVVRGAPAIGVTAAWGCCIAASECNGASDWRPLLRDKLELLAEARPTAVNLRWGVEAMRREWEADSEQYLSSLMVAWLDMAESIHQEDVKTCRILGRHGAALMEDGDTVLTHCNAGALATAGYGTALGVIRAAVEEGKRIEVIADETRPWLQGARLTTWELHMDGIPVRVAPDNNCGLLMARGMVQKVVVGADRIAMNGDTANKIGTYMVAALAKRHGIPFYIAAPLSTIDPDTTTGRDIPIEERPSEEVVSMAGTRLVPEGVGAYNFAFDVTPAELISGIITEKGVIMAPYETSLRALFCKDT